MENGEEFLWRPMLAGLCTYRDITENRVDLCALAEMNELLDIKEINDNRLRDAQQRRAEAEARNR